MAADHLQPSALVRPGERPLPAFWAEPRWERGLPSVFRNVVVRRGRDRLTTSAASLACYVMPLTWRWLVNLVLLLGLELDECVRRRRVAGRADVGEEQSAVEADI